MSYNEAMGLARPTPFGRYELLAELGRGGMAEVFAARMVSVGGFSKSFAIKRMLPHLAQDAQFVTMFTQEARIAARLAHPNICQVFELGQVDDELFIAMELLDGVAWDRVLALDGAAELRLVSGVIVQAAEGLHYAHELRDEVGLPAPVIHRDVSPQNLFVTSEGVCKLLDFGVAKALSEGPHTRTGVLKGKLPYMSPEQIRGEPLDGRADVFALGVVAWESLTGERLFERPTDFLVWKAIGEEPIPTVTSRRPQLPAAIDAVIARALARDRELRYATARDFASALVQVGGMMLPREIAEALRGTCAVLRAPRAPVAERSAASTIEDGPASTVSMKMRRDAVIVERPRPRRWPVFVAVATIAAAAIAIALVVTRPHEAPIVATAHDEVPAVAIPQPVATPPDATVAIPAPRPQPAPAHAPKTAATPSAPAHDPIGGLTEEKQRKLATAIEVLGKLADPTAAEQLRKLGALAPTAGASWDCKKDPVVMIIGNGGTITATGACTSIGVAGNRNTVTAESAVAVEVTGTENTVKVTAVDKISTPGDRNKVSYSKSITAKTPAVSNLGNDNTIANSK